MTADRQKCRLENEAQAHGKKVKSHRPKHSGTQFNNRVHDCREKTDGRKNEKISIHSDGLS
jgi:hypothetical protein